MLTSKSANFSDNCAATNSLFPSWVDEGSQPIRRSEKEKSNRLTFAFLESSRLASISVLCRKQCVSRNARAVRGYTQMLTVSFSRILVKSHLSFHPNVVYCKCEGVETLDLYRCWLPCLWLEHMCCVLANISSFVPHREFESRVDHNSSNLWFDQSTGLPAGAPNSLQALSFIRVLLSYLKTS